MQLQPKCHGTRSNPRQRRAGYPQSLPRSRQSGGQRQGGLRRAKAGIGRGICRSGVERCSSGADPGDQKRPGGAAQEAGEKGMRKKPIRILIGMAAVVSLFLFAASAALWIRSYWRHDLRVSKFGTVQSSIESVRGSLRFCTVSSAYPYPPGDVGAAWYSQPTFPSATLEQTYHLRSRQWLFASGGLIEGDFREGAIYPGEPPMPYRVIVVPYWLIAGMFSILPMAWLARW